MQLFVVIFPSFFSLELIFKTKNLYFCSLWKIRAIFSVSLRNTLLPVAQQNWSQGSCVPLFPLQGDSVTEKMAKIAKPRHRGDRIGLQGQMHFLTIPNNPDLQCEISEGYMQNSAKYKILEAIS